MAKKMKFTVAPDNIFSLTFSEPKASRLQLRSNLMILLKKYIEHENITQREAAKRFGVTQSRISHLIHCRGDLFSNDMLIEMLEKVGFKIYEKIQTDVAKIVHFPKINHQKIRMAAN